MNQQQIQSHTSKTLTGSRLRSYAFTLLTRREYSKQELLEKLQQYAINPQEVEQLVDELAEQHYQSDERVAENLLASQIRKGKGLYRIQQALQSKGLEQDLIQDELAEIDWFQHAYQLKVKKFGTEIVTDPKLKAKQIRFLQYRGFNMDIIFKVIQHQADDEYE